MSEQWERGEHPAQAEVHEPITEFDGPIGVDPDERTDVTYEVTISVPDRQASAEWIPTEGEIARAIYQGIEDIDSEDAITVERR